MSLASVQEDKARLLLVHSCTHLLGIQSIAEFPCPDGRYQFEVAPVGCSSVFWSMMVSAAKWSPEINF